MNILNLSDDCLHLIFKELTFREQISIARVCTRFENVAASLWKTERKEICLDLFEMPLGINELQCLLKNIHNTVERIRIKFLDKTTYDIFKALKYKNLYDFRFSLDRAYNSFINDEGILTTFSKCIPKLSTFSPEGYLTGKYFNELTSLKTLTLTHCFSLAPLYLQDILNSLELQSLNLDIYDENCDITIESHFKCLTTLQEIKINSDGLKLLFKLMLYLNQLRSIKVTDIENKENINDLMMQIYLHKKIKAVSMTTQYLTFEKNDFSILPPIKVKSLIFLETKMKKIDFKKFENIFANLNELHFHQRYIYKNSREMPDFSYILPLCKNLKLINFQLNEDLFCDLSEGTKNMLLERTEPLRINIYPSCMWMQQYIQGEKVLITSEKILEKPSTDYYIHIIIERS